MWTPAGLPRHSWPLPAAVALTVLKLGGQVLARERARGTRRHCARLARASGVWARARFRAARHALQRRPFVQGTGLAELVQAGATQPLPSGTVDELGNVERRRRARRVGRPRWRLGRDEHGHLERVPPGRRARCLPAVGRGGARASRRVASRSCALREPAVLPREEVPRALRLVAAVSAAAEDLAVPQTVAAAVGDAVDAGVERDDVVGLEALGRAAPRSTAGLPRTACRRRRRGAAAGGQHARGWHRRPVGRAETTSAVSSR